MPSLYVSQLIYRSSYIVSCGYKCMKKAERKYPDRQADSCKRSSANRIAAGSRLSWIFLLSATLQTYCPKLNIFSSAFSWLWSVILSYNLYSNLYSLSSSFPPTCSSTLDFIICLSKQGRLFSVRGFWAQVMTIKVMMWVCEICHK